MDKEINLKPLKRQVALRLTPGDPVREALMGEPDRLPRREALPKLAAYAKLLLASRQQHVRLAERP